MSEFYITDTQKESYLTNGYVHFKGAIPLSLIERWQDKAEQLEKEGLKRYTEGEASTSIAISQDTVGPRVMRYNNVNAAESQLSSELLSSHAMVMIYRELCGAGCIPINMDLIYKQQHPHPIVNWHQDAPHSRAYPFANIGIYLDDAKADDGCLRLVPKSHFKWHDIEQLTSSYGWDIPGVVEVPVQAGDIVVHDMMILHGSMPKRSSGVRRTLYLECRPMAAIQDEGRNSREWLELRKQWMAQILKQSSTGLWPDDWQQDYPNVMGDHHALMVSIRDKREPTIPANWGKQVMVTDNYPIPFYLR
ncbi:MAG: phytanoyl-CoA dioxygenase family protein [Pseudomonadota bacterium]|nr:phytanoyl-CoA dioxygenase family protein [Pseudomonadota bacterium]